MPPTPCLSVWPRSEDLKNANNLTECILQTPCGDIHYWVGGVLQSRQTLVFLPGLTADRRLFERQVEYFETGYNVLVWDAPAHGTSRPFELTYSLADIAAWLHDILKVEGLERPVLVGQSMGGYIAQSFIEQFPDEAAGFVSIDSAPLARKYTSAFEIWALRNSEPVYRAFPWRLLVKAGSYGCAMTEYGRSLMREMMLGYSKDEYCSLAGHGYRILADALADGKEYRLTCPTLLVCGDRDRAAAAMRYNRAWAGGENLPIRWIAGAGHNSNTDRPDEINTVIEEFVAGLL